MLCVVAAVACVAVGGGVQAAGGDIFYFSAWPASGRVAAGEERVLRCAVSDAASITLTWHLDGRPLTYSSRRRVRGEAPPAFWKVNEGLPGKHMQVDRYI